MPTIPESYVNMRAELLAKVFLTRQPATVTEMGDDELNYLVRLQPEKDANKIVPTFGVILVATVKEIEGEPDADSLARAQWEKRQKLGHMMPVVFLLYSLHNDEGYLAWAQEPSIESEYPTLLRHEVLRCKRVSTKTYDSLTAQIRAWYKNLGKLIFVKD